MKTCILIPAAGKGKRFIREKYKTYKPFLKIHQKELSTKYFKYYNTIIQNQPSYFN